LAVAGLSGVTILAVLCSLSFGILQDFSVYGILWKYVVPMAVVFVILE
jgi:hypothetical protein